MGLAGSEWAFIPPSIVGRSDPPPSHGDSVHRPISQRSCIGAAGSLCNMSGALRLEKRYKELAIQALEIA
jgi:hypothetical protein